jgi:hypothetical protein
LDAHHRDGWKQPNAAQQESNHIFWDQPTILLDFTFWLQHILAHRCTKVPQSMSALWQLHIYVPGCTKLYVWDWATTARDTVRNAALNGNYQVLDTIQEALQGLKKPTSPIGHKVSMMFCHLLTSLQMKVTRKQKIPPKSSKFAKSWFGA